MTPAARLQNQIKQLESKFEGSLKQCNSARKKFEDIVNRYGVDRENNELPRPDIDTIAKLVLKGIFDIKRDFETHQIISSRNIDKIPDTIKNGPNPIICPPHISISDEENRLRTMIAETENKTKFYKSAAERILTEMSWKYLDIHFVYPDSRGMLQCDSKSYANKSEFQRSKKELCSRFKLNCIEKHEILSFSPLSRKVYESDDKKCTLTTVKMKHPIELKM